MPDKTETGIKGLYQEDVKLCSLIFIAILVGLIIGLKLNTFFAFFISAGISIYIGYTFMKRNKEKEGKYIEVEEWKSMMKKK